MRNWTPQNDLEREDLRIFLKAAQSPNQDGPLQAFIDQFLFTLKSSLRKQMLSAKQEDLEDAYQGLLEKLLFGEALAGYDPLIASPRTYLRVVTRRYAIDLHRRKETRPIETSYDDSFTEETSRLVDQAPDTSEDELVRRILEYAQTVKPDKVRLQVYERILEEGRVEDIAREVHLSQPTIYRYRQELLEISKVVLGMDTKKKR